MVETLAQDWSSMDGKCNMNVLVVIRDRMLSWAGHVARMDYKEICAKALKCRGLQWWRWRQLNWKEVEKDTWSGPHPQRFKIYRWEDMVAEEVSKFVGNADGLSKTVEAGSNSRNVERALKRWSRVLRGPMRVRHGWGRCRCLCVGSERIWERVVWRAPGTPLSMSSQVGVCSDVPHGTVLVMIGRVRMARDMDVDVAAGVEMPRSFGSARRAEWPFRDVARKC